MKNRLKLLNVCVFWGSVLMFGTVFAQQHKAGLKKGDVFTRKVIPAEQHRYRIHLKNGMGFLAEVQERGIDVAIDVEDDKSMLVKRYDSSHGMQGLEKIDFSATQTGWYTFVFSVLEESAAGGSYEFKVLEVLEALTNGKRLMRKELQSTAMYKLWESYLTDKNAIDHFLKKQRQKHLIEKIPGNDKEMLVTYFCVPSKHTEYVMLSGGPDFLGLRFHPLGTSKLHFVSQRVPVDARFAYGFNYFEKRNFGPTEHIIKRSIEHAYDGLVTMPAAPEQPYTVIRKGVPKGEVKSMTIASEILQENRKIKLCLPAGFDRQKEYHLLVVFDGEAYGVAPRIKDRVPVPTIMDNLHAEGVIKPTVTVLVASMGKRKKDMISDKFSNFIAKELIPGIRSQYSIAPGPDKVVLAGSSRGGFAASFIAYQHADVVGNVLSQSGSYWIKAETSENHWIYPESDGKLIRLYREQKKLPLRFYMEVGLYESGASMLGMNRQFRDILVLKGYPVQYSEFKGGHNYQNWRGTFAKGVKALLGIQK